MKYWGVLIVGVMLGLAGGLLYAWVIAPPEYYDTYPPLLNKPYRNEWIHMTVLAYGAEGDWDRVRLRLQDLPKADVGPIAAQALDQAVAAGHPLETLRQIAELAAFYGVDTPAIHIYTGEIDDDIEPTLAPTAIAEALPPTPTPTAAPLPTAIPPTNTPLPYPTVGITAPLSPPLNAFHLVSQTLTCADPPQIAVSLMLSHTITTRRGEEVEWLSLPGREVWLLWEDGADRAVTGFNLEMGLGYADFIVAPGRVYKLYIDVPRGAPISTIQVEPCAARDGEGWVSRLLVLLER